MLTARYEQLGLERGDTMLDLGCGFGRHAFEAARRGAAVIALNAGAISDRAPMTMLARTKDFRTVPPVPIVVVEL